MQIDGIGLAYDYIHNDRHVLCLTRCSILLLAWCCRRNLAMSVGIDLGLGHSMIWTCLTNWCSARTRMAHRCRVILVISWTTLSRLPLHLLFRELHYSVCGSGSSLLMIVLVAIEAMVNYKKPQLSISNHNTRWRWQWCMDVLSCIATISTAEYSKHVPLFPHTR